METRNEWNDSRLYFFLKLDPIAKNFVICIHALNINRDKKDSQGTIYKVSDNSYLALSRLGYFCLI